MCDIFIVGAAIADVLIRPVDGDVRSCAVDSIRLSLGGDAMNEATVLARLGHRPMLVTKLGQDAAAELVLAHCARENIRMYAARDGSIDTGINAVLVGSDGERSFITNRNGSLRRLSLNDILPALETEAFAGAKIACLASMFVSPMLNAEDMEALFARIKSAGKILCADTTKRKNGETARDVAGALKHLDYFFPNREEAALLTGQAEPDAIADCLLDVGVKNVALKLGAQGCLLKNARQRILVPAYPKVRCLDTTGAGDTFAAAFMSGLLEGCPLAECGARANAAASICIERLGATSAPMDPAEIDKRYSEILARL